MPKRYKPDMLILIIPFIIANIIQLGKIFYDNNKLMWVSLLFINIYAAWLIVNAITIPKERFAQNTGKYLKPILVRLAVLLIVLSTATGIVDLIGVLRMRTITIADQSSELRKWIVDHTKKSSVFMTWSSVPFGDSPVTTINLAGRMLYNVSSCVDASCDVEPRLSFVYSVYEGAYGSVEETRLKLEEEKVDYIIIDDLLRTKFAENEKFLDENFFSDNFPLVYQLDTLHIYQVR
jgi:hypothetical protein